MDVGAVSVKILAIANSMIRESTLPDFSFSPKDRAEGVRVSAFDQLDRVFESDRHGRSQH
jgi:hypothetical protein